MSRPALAVVGWTSVGGRLHEVAAALGGEAHIIYPFGERASGSAGKLLRYLASMLMTASYLARHRPRAVMVVNPPVLAPIVPILYGRITGAPVIIDSHPGGFGAQGDALSAKLQPIHRWAARRAAAVTVSMGDWAELVAGWGGKGLLLHEAPGEWTAGLEPPQAVNVRPQVLWIGVFHRDEPVEVLLSLAAKLPEVDVLVTGDPAKAPDSFRGPDVPPNLRLLGYLNQTDYRAAVLAADVIIVLTTDRTSVMRSAYEAVYALKPLVVTDFPVLREFFPDAIFSDNDGEALALSVKNALTGWDALVAAAPAARIRQIDRWESQLAALRALLPMSGRTNVTSIDTQRKQTEVEG